MPKSWNVYNEISNLLSGKGIKEYERMNNFYLIKLNEWDTDQFSLPSIANKSMLPDDLD
jgi:hypothetical protein